MSPLPQPQPPPFLPSSLPPSSENCSSALAGAAIGARNSKPWRLISRASSTADDRAEGAGAPEADEEMEILELVVSGKSGGSSIDAKPCIAVQCSCCGELVCCGF